MECGQHFGSCNDIFSAFYGSAYVPEINGRSPEEDACAMVLHFRPPCHISAVVFVTVKNENQTSTPLLTLGMPLGLVCDCIGVHKCQHMYQPSRVLGVP